MDPSRPSPSSYRTSATSTAAAARSDSSRYAYARLAGIGYLVIIATGIFRRPPRLHGPRRVA